MDAALRSLERHATPDDPEALVRLAHVHARAGRALQAWTCFVRAGREGSEGGREIGRVIARDELPARMRLAGHPSIRLWARFDPREALSSERSARWWPAEPHLDQPVRAVDLGRAELGELEGLRVVEALGIGYSERPRSLDPVARWSSLAWLRLGPVSLAQAPILGSMSALVGLAPVGGVPPGLLAVLHRVPRLTMLDLRAARFTRKGERQISRLRSLRHLWLAPSHWRSLERLRAALPACDVR